MNLHNLEGNRSRREQEVCGRVDRRGEYGHRGKVRWAKDERQQSRS